ncbi:oxidoreductase [Alkalihalobacillus alcalophilus ATCC 27647 = CGMCC 1.3604]|uniref:Oxidoreductase n=1 Tax=Alkalihalobacillus alcalophilus ATCC 27647 = CGMCC 1.3604 TaxID=1218173 RepID=A0A094WF42_ALKAL|nr:Gfo/Idh/MocA family oxidoreductase [Alkalihalobacillus alcalophilus]KGA96369.1 oxidoreductase [Alkalihalobacillus alcalophilus ATCC 27647 = CGMCC 1.3604]MED1563492.1 Gfo/Idh/MocA family oxidoreductase [Alkalihalobacillus alcalophilus]THG90614.1 oxidoreductase [Alkalihalobacillus alcalophilus ATCC 27647 = CGMCC 1.3604]
MEKVRWGIIGSANIAKKAVIPGIQQSETGEVVAIASRTKEKAEEMAEELSIPVAYGSYDELLDDPTIEAVYIPLPNHLHKEWTIRAAEAGKHVLCEKPAALNGEEAKEMEKACEKAGVILAEAFMYRYHPRYSLIKEIMESGEIGEIRGIHGTFTFNNAQNFSNIRYKKEWGGGSLYDVGVYPISAARMLLGKEPQAATVHAFFSEEHDDVDMMASGLLEFDQGVSLTFDCGMWAAFRNTLEIVGTEGRIEVPSAFITGQSAEDHFFVITNDGKVEVEVPRLNQYALQADAIGKRIRNDVPIPYPASDAVLNMKVLEACLLSAEERRRIEIK